MKKDNKKLINFKIKYILTILLIGVICFIISNYFVSFCVINGDSMLPTYENGQILIENKIVRNYKSGDIVVIKKNNLKIIKRVIGCPGDYVLIKEGYIYINNEKYDNLFIENPGILSKEIKLKSNEFIVLGDNRKKSIDSRFDEIGIILKKEIIGKIIKF